MSVNTAHANHGVLIHSGEWILLFSDNVNIEFVGQDNPVFKGTKNGRIYLTTHRIIFNNKNTSDPMQSFSSPFVAMNDIDIEQPILQPNHIKGKVRAQPNGNWSGEAKFKIFFKSGGAIDFGQAMKRAANMAQRYMRCDAPPPYTPPTGSWYEAPPPAYQAPPGYYGWIPTGDGLSNSPPPNTVYMSDNPPPYPGISGQPHAAPAQNGYPGYMGGTVPTNNYAGNPGGYPGNSGGYPGNPGGYPANIGGYQDNVGGSPGFPGATAFPGNAPSAPFGNPSAPQPGGYLGYPGNSGGFTGYPSVPQHNGSPAGMFPNMGYPGGGPGHSVGGMGFTAGHSQNAKETEAAQSAYYDPSRPQTAYVPPPAYYEPPPSYDSVSKKNQ